MDEDGGVLGVGLIRTFGVEGEEVAAGQFPQSLTGGGSGSGSSGGTSGGSDGASEGGSSGNGALRMGVGVPELVFMMLAWVFVWRGVFGRRL